MTGRLSEALFYAWLVLWGWHFVLHNYRRLERLGVHDRAALASARSALAEALGAAG